MTAPIRGYLWKIVGKREILNEMSLTQCFYFIHFSFIYELGYILGTCFAVHYSKRDKFDIKLMTTNANSHKYKR